MKKICVLLFIFVLLVVIFIVFKFNRKKVDISSVKYFHFGYSTGNMMYANVSYDVRYEDDEYVATIKLDGVSDDDAVKVSLATGDVRELEDILKKYDVGKWNGFQKSDKNVLDGNSFSLSVSFVNGESISASGYMMYPSNYKEVRDALNSYFMKIYKR